MFYSISGKLELTLLNLAVIETGGIAYSIKTTTNTIGKLPTIGTQTKLFTFVYVKEDILELFGFYSLEELNCFKMLISVSGVGPKAAISILSSVSPQDFIIAVATGEVKIFTSVKGIGTKIAQRIVLELKDKITNEQLGETILSNERTSTVGKTNNSEAIKALIALGYSSTEATKAISKLDSTISVEEMIKIGLKSLY